MPKSVEEKARDYLSGGRLTLQELFFESNAGHARLLFHVNGSDPEPYYVKARRDSPIHPWEWTCDCPARVDDCAHVLAAKMLLPNGTIVGKEPPPAEDPDISKILGT